MDGFTIATTGSDAWATSEALTLRKVKMATIKTKTLEAASVSEVPRVLSLADIYQLRSQAEDILFQADCNHPRSEYPNREKWNQAVARARELTAQLDQILNSTIPILFAHASQWAEAYLLLTEQYRLLHNVLNTDLALQNSGRR